MRTIIIAAIIAIAFAAPAAAQEDVEPRTVGGAGVTTIGFAGFIDKFASSETTFPTHASLHVDISRFITARFAARGGLLGSTTFGEVDDEAVTGPGAAALHAFGGAQFYFTPQAMASFYTGAEYRAQLTGRAGKDAGTLLGVGGLQATVSSRASVFVQAGYGARLSRGDEGEWQTRVTVEIGFRFRF
ncbi:MAG: hypothetical protein AB7P34_20170 [Vicinamibacterales bacterium]